MESVKKEIGDLGHTGPYRPPARLRKRSEFSSKGAGDEKVFEANEYVFLLSFTTREMSSLVHKQNRFINSDFHSLYKCLCECLKLDFVFAGKLWVWCSTKTPNGTSSGRTLKITT